MADSADHVDRDGAVVVMNARSGDGKVDRFGLVERAQAVGAWVRLTSPDHDAAGLARAAVAEGASVLGVAGGDGTVSAVAAVAAAARLPLVVIPAGTRNHFARDLGLNTANPALAVAALHANQPIWIDLGQVGSRIFINNVSFGAYADALLTPGYREAKARTFAEIGPGYLHGQQWINATVDTPEGPVEHAQVVLISNNPYHTSTPRDLGRRFALDTGELGGIVLKRPATAPPPDVLARLGHEIQQGQAGPPGEGLITWTATQITLYGPAAQLPAGIDGEAATLDLPIVCQIRPRALQILLPAATSPDPGVAAAATARLGHRTAPSSTRTQRA